MQKSPVPSPDSSPRCFGFAYDREDTKCRRCLWKRACVPPWRVWNLRKSIAESCAELEASLAIPTIDQASIERMYDALYLQHFQKRSRRRMTPQNNTIFGRLLSFCLQEEVDPETFIAANMVRMLRNGLPPCGFQPNMLSGERAKGRYNAFVRGARRRYKRTLADVSSSASKLGVLRSVLFTSERDVGDLFVRSCLQSRTEEGALSWEEATGMSDPDEVWFQFQREAGSEYARFERAYGRQRALQERQLATLRAAVSVAESLEVRLSTRVGCTEFQWEGFAELVCELFQPPDRASVDLGNVSGTLWGVGA